MKILLKVLQSVIDSDIKRWKKIVWTVRSFSLWTWQMLSVWICAVRLLHVCPIVGKANHKTSVLQITTHKHEFSVHCTALFTFPAFQYVFFNLSLPGRTKYYWTHKQTKRGEMTSKYSLGLALCGETQAECYLSFFFNSICRVIKCICPSRIKT